MALGVVVGKQPAPSLNAKTVALGYIEGNAIELASLRKDSVFERRSLGATKKKVCV